MRMPCRMVRGLPTVFVGILLAIAGAVEATECYSPDARSKERAFSRAVITVTGFARPGVMVEVQGVAVVGGK